jgi:hypothetical protein
VHRDTYKNQRCTSSTASGKVSKLSHYVLRMSPTLILHPPPMLMPPPDGIAVLDAMTLLPVTVGIMFAISDAPVIAAEAMDVIMLWSIVKGCDVTGGRFY